MVVLNSIEAGTTAPRPIFIENNPRSPISIIDLNSGLRSAPDLQLNTHAHETNGHQTPLDTRGIIFEAPQTPYEEMRGAASEVLRNMGIKVKDREEMLGSFDRLHEGEAQAVADFKATLSDFQDGVVDPLLEGLRKAAEIIDQEAIPILTFTEVVIGAGMAGYLAADFILRSHRSLITKNPQARKSLGKIDRNRLFRTATLFAGIGGIIAGCTGIVWATTAPIEASPTLPAPVIRVTRNLPTPVDSQPSATVPASTPATLAPEKMPMPETVTEALYDAHALLDIELEGNTSYVAGTLISLKEMNDYANGAANPYHLTTHAAKDKWDEMQKVLGLSANVGVNAKEVYTVWQQGTDNNFIILVNKDTVPGGTNLQDWMWIAVNQDGKLNFQPNASVGLDGRGFGLWPGPGDLGDKTLTSLWALNLDKVGGIEGLFADSGMRGRIVFQKDGNGIAYIVALDAQGKVVQVFDAVSGTWLESETASIPEPIATFTNEQIASMDDAQILQRAPILNSTDYQFDTEFSLVADVVIRGGEGANYVVYKDEAGNYQLVWNIETGEVNHAIYTAAYERKIGNEVYQGVPLLVITDKSILEPGNGGGWFGLNPDYTDAQARVAEAFQIALGMRYWDDHIRPADRFPFVRGLPDFSDVPGYETLGQELERYFLPQNGHSAVREKTPKYLRVKIANYMRDKFLLDLKGAKDAGVPFPVQMTDKGRTEADLAGINTFIIDFTVSGKLDLWDNETILNQKNSYGAFSYTFISAQNLAKSFRLIVDNWNYKYQTNRWFGSEFLALLRYAFAGQFFAQVPYAPGWGDWVQKTGSDFTHQIAAVMLSDQAVSDTPELAEALNHYTISYPFLWSEGYPPDWFTDSGAVIFDTP